MHIYDEKSDFVKKIFSKKRVVIVGPAGYLDDCNFGSYIDSYDVVVRFLESLKTLQQKTQVKKIGSRCDVIVTSLSAAVPAIPQINWKDAGRIILCPFFSKGYYVYLDKGIGALKAHSLKNKLDINLCMRTKASFVEFWKQVQAGPTTGVSAIDYILQCDVKELHLTGFTFHRLLGKRYMTSYAHNVQPDMGRWHYPLADEVYCNKLIKFNKTITVDSYIKTHVLLTEKELNIKIKQLTNNPKGHRYREGM